MQENSGLVEKQRNAFTAFFSPPTSTPLIRNTSPQPPPPPPTTKRIAPKITPRQRTTRPPKKVWKQLLIIISFRPQPAPSKDVWRRAQLVGHPHLLEFLSFRSLQSFKVIVIMHSLTFPEKRYCHLTHSKLY